MNQIKPTKKNSKPLRSSKRRGTSEIIAALLLVAITVVGAVLLTVFLDDNFVAASENEASKNTSSKFVRLLGYDTRDSTNLFQLNLNNTFSDNLMGEGVFSGDENKLPKNGGTEFIVMQIQNQGVNSVWLSDIYINGVNHVWDPDTASKILDASADDVTGKYPKAGMFSIILPSSDTQNPSTQIESGQTVNLIVKLGLEDQDIDLNEKLRILLNVGANQPVDFVIESGDAK